MKAALVVIVSVFLSLLLCEAGLRLFTRYGPGAPEPPTTAVAPDKPLDLAGAVPVHSENSRRPWNGPCRGLPKILPLFPIVRR